MRTIQVLTFMLLFSTFTLSAQDKKETKQKKTEEVTFVVSMSCDNCKKRIEKNVSWEKGVKDLQVDLEKKTVKITYDPKKITEEKLKQSLEALGYTAEKKE